MMRDQEPRSKPQSMSERFSGSRVTAGVLAGVAVSAIVVTGCEAPSDKTTEGQSEVVPGNKTIEGQSEIAADKAMEALEVSDIYDFKLIDAEVEAEAYVGTNFSTGKKAAHTVIDVNLQRDETPEYTAAAKDAKLEGLKLKKPIAYYPEWYTQQFCDEDEIHDIQWLEGLSKKSTINGRQPRTGNDIFFIERNDDEGAHRIAVNANKIQSGTVNIELRYVINPIIHSQSRGLKEDHEMLIQKVGEVTFSIEDGKVTDLAVDPVD